MCSLCGPELEPLFPDKIISLSWWLKWKRICLPMQEMLVQSLGSEDPLEKEMVTHSNILTWDIPWTEEPGRLQSMGPQKCQTWLATKQQEMIYKLTGITRLVLNIIESHVTFFFLSYFSKFSPFLSPKGILRGPRGWHDFFPSSEKDLPLWSHLLIGLTGICNLQHTGWSRAKLINSGINSVKLILEFKL